MKKFIRLFFVISFIYGFGQNSQKETNLMKQVNEMGKFNEKYDIKNSVNYLYPPLITYLGGKENVIKTFTDSFNRYKKEGIVFEKYSYENPYSIISYKGDLQAAVVQKITVRTPEGKMIDENTVIAISKDGGNSWKFIGVTKDNQKEIKKVYPNLSPALKITIKDPVMIE